jgi:DNA primase
LVEEDLILLRKVKNLVLAFDQDEAGAKCTARFKQYLPAARVLGGYGGEGCKDLGELRAAMGTQAFTERLNRFLERRSTPNTAELRSPLQQASRRAGRKP